MALHDFRYVPSKSSPPAAPELSPSITPDIPNHPDRSRQVEILGTDPIDTHVEDVFSAQAPGFRSLDEALKLYFTKPVIEIPTRDGVKTLEVRISGGEKAVLFWKQDLQGGRVKLPIMGINRTGWDYNPAKFSPAYRPLIKLFAPHDRDKSRIRNIFRPVPYFVNYQLTIWGEKKHDVEHAMFQILPRFNPLARMFMQDAILSGPVDMHLDGSTDNSDIESEAERLARIRYDVNIRAEAWLPLPEKFVPTILGRVQTLNDQTGALLQTFSTTGGV